MQWATGQTFEILAIGNGEFMHRVFLALSMLWSSGIFASLGAIGLLVGLVALGPQAVASGGQRMDIGSLFTGFILWLVFFAGGATVLVQEVGYNRPGSNTPGAWVVDNVPFGVAATGWLVSNVGKRVTEKMEQAYGLVDEEQSVLKTGHGRALEWLAAIRTAADINIGTLDTKFGVMRANLMQYMRWCSVPAAKRDPRRVPVMTSSPDPLDADKGFGFSDTIWHTTDWYVWSEGGGKPALDQDVKCGVALDRLRGYFQSPGGEAFQDFASSAARPRGFYSGNTPGQQAISAAAALNLSVDAAQKYMLASMMTDLWHEAAAGSPLLTSQEVANLIMMKQAVEQKATQSAGEESMFRRTMYPLMTFLESAFYITAPFMALVIGMGRIGLGMASKFVMIPLWLAMWLPTLAVINMFQIISFRSVMDGLKSTVLNAGSPYEIGSLASASHIQSSALDWMATGSMLAAATPMISLMFLMGGAYTATALAGAFKGSDVINEKIPSPDVAQPAAALQAQPLMRYSAQGGTEMVGASVPTHSTASTRSDLIQSGNALLRSNTSSFNATFGKQIQTAVQNAFESGHGASVVDSHAVRRGMENTFSLAQKSGVDAGDASKIERALALTAARSLVMDASVDTGALGGGLNASGAYKTSAELRSALARTLSLGAKLSEAATNNEALSAAMTDTSATMAEEHSRQTGTESSGFTGSSAYQQQRSSLAQSMNRQQVMAQQGSQMSTNQQFSAPQVAQAMGSRPTQGGASNIALDEVQRAIETFGADRLTEVSEGLRGTVGDTPLPPGRYGGSVSERAAYAAYLLNTGQAVGQEVPDAKTAADYAQNRYRIETESGVANTNTGASAARANVPDRASIQAGMEAVNNAVGDVQGEVMANNPGSEKTEGDIRSQHESSRRNVDASAAHVGGEAARGMEAEGGGFNQGEVDAHFAPLQERADTRLDAMDRENRAQLAPIANEMQREDDAGDFLGSVKGMLGITNYDTGVFHLQRMQSASSGNQADNPMFEQAVAAAKSGNLIRGVYLNDDAAVATAGLWAMNGGGLSERQMSAVKTAFGGMSEDQTRAQIDLYGKMGMVNTEMKQENIPMNAATVLGRRITPADLEAPGTPAPYSPARGQPHHYSPHPPGSQ